jgi:hypothetical protein
MLVLLLEFGMLGEVRLEEFMFVQARVSSSWEERVEALRQHA